jgi:pilus assembly protein Flp/PilA
MNALRTRVRQFLTSEDGPTATEYAVMIAIICVAAFTALGSFGAHMNNIYTSIASSAQVL